MCWVCDRTDAGLKPSACVSAQYGEFRAGFDGDTEDTRLVFYGMRYIIENFVARQWTQRDVDEAALFFKCAGPAVCIPVYCATASTTPPCVDSQPARSS